MSKLVFAQSSLRFWNLLINVKIIRSIVHIFVAFSENLNFNKNLTKHQRTLRSQDLNSRDSILFYNVILLPTHLKNLNLKDDGNEMKTTKALFHLCIVVFYVKNWDHVVSFRRTIVQWNSDLLGTHLLRGT